jgi:hypothetical protein
MGCDIHTIAQVNKNNEWVTVADNIGDEWRSYHTYAILANVRNGRGFAGVSTGDLWEPIDEARGYPEGFLITHHTDMHIWFKDSKKFEKWMGDHSHSWLMLSEIEDYIENRMPKTYVRHGYVSPEVFDDFVKHGKNPTEWCGGTSDKTYKAIQWTVPAKEAAGYLIEIVNHLRKIKEEHKTNDVRFVFGFDN